MKLILHKPFLFLIILTIVGCKENNVFDSLGDQGSSTLANVYMEPLAPKLQAGTERDLEVQFWSLDDNITYTGLWDYALKAQSFETKVNDIVFNIQTEEDFQDWTEATEYTFSFADWTPDINAYLKNITYNIDVAYDATSEKSVDISSATFISRLPENFETEMFSFYTSNLSRSELNTLMLDNAIMTQSKFDSQYAESGFFTTDGRTAMTAGLAEIGTPVLVGNNFEIKTEYQITLAFRVINGSQNSNESRRSFDVF